MAATNCFRNEYNNSDCTLEVRLTVSSLLSLMVKEPAKPNAQSVSIDLEITGNKMVPLRDTDESCWEKLTEY